MPAPSSPPMITPWTGPSDPTPEQAVKAKVCPCEVPQIYYEEDGERRCLCGRAAR